MTTRKKIFLVIILLIQISIIWPVYPLFSDISPMILGLPLSFAWVVGMLIASFLTILWYYLTDPERKSPESQTS
ncbi:hypothetical protein NC796_08410 [Aliifodinibius sp. S!AR15-10]|uniref:hypothetical protein n=1 Tax=Aliifodinibius sp. S!AR15-10 TaxID=2950437 RepID=UPI00285AD4E2|nr:hypothetical protein [Aliifodinibius sp. S!AR15-10]MDR8391156.1 hypothetical protein [Aliifodinibius sp. S!AR15-10]